MSNIYFIQEELKVLLAEIEENEGVVDNEFWDAFLVTQETFKQKLKSYCHVLKEYESKIAFADSEIKRIANYQRVKQTTYDRIEKIILDALKQFGEKDPKKKYLEIRIRYL